MLTPDQFLFAALSVLGLGLFIAYETGSLAEERRRRARPLTIGRLVEIHAGPNAGLAGWIYAMLIDARSGKPIVTIRTQAGEFVTVDRENVSTLFG